MLGGPYLNGMTNLEGLGDCFDNLGRDSIVLGRISHEGILQWVGLGGGVGLKIGHGIICGRLWR